MTHLLYLLVHASKHSLIDSHILGASELSAVLCFVVSIIIFSVRDVRVIEFYRHGATWSQCGQQIVLTRLV